MQALSKLIRVHSTGQTDARVGMFVCWCGVALCWWYDTTVVSVTFVRWFPDFCEGILLVGKTRTHTHTYTDTEYCSSDMQDISLLLLKRYYQLKQHTVNLDRFLFSFQLMLLEWVGLMSKLVEMMCFCFSQCYFTMKWTNYNVACW